VADTAVKNGTGKKILAFSCAGEGFGHIARIVALSEYLRNDFEIIYFVPKSVQGFLLKNLGTVRIVTIPSFHFVLRDHGIDYLRTVKENIGYFLNYADIVSEIKKRLSEYRIDSLICDFEPFVSRSAASLGIPFMNFSHPGILIKTFPLSFSGFCSRAVARFMTPAAQANLFCSFYNGEIGPVIRREIREKEPVYEDFYLVYTKKDSQKQMLDCLQYFPDKRFAVYPREGGDFAESLCRCRGIIAPAGHQLISEALYLGKPILAFPQKGQYEQTVNARMLEKSGRGFYGKVQHMQRDMQRFFDHIEEFPYCQNRFERFCFTDDTRKIVKFITGFVRTYSVAKKVKNIYAYTYFDTIQEKIRILREELQKNLHTADRTSA
jgi:uncharacterized protein (TIGR00661 family)